VISLLENSRRPLLAVGLTAARLDLKDELLSFLDTCKIPVVITPMAKGLIPEDHPAMQEFYFIRSATILKTYTKNQISDWYRLRPG